MAALVETLRRWTSLPAGLLLGGDVSGQRRDRLLRRGPGGIRVRPRRWYEDGGAVVTQLSDRVDDVGQRAMAAGLCRRVEVDLRIPPPAEFLDARHVDHSIMQVVVESRHVARDEGPVRGD